MLPSGSEILFIKKEGESRWGKGLRVGGWGRRRFSRLPASHLLLPPILQDGAGNWDGAICIDDVQCFLDESFRQRCNNNIVHTSPLVGHLITKMQRLIAT